MSASPDLHAWLDARRVAVERALDAALPAPPACPPPLADAMRYSLLAGGKRLRPILALAAAEATDPDHLERARTAAMPAACALELIHTYSLIHDDLPAMDDDTLRRGRPTNHVVYGEGLAILAGDGLLTEAFVHARARTTGGAGHSADRPERTKASCGADRCGGRGRVRHGRRPGHRSRGGGPGAGASFDAEGLRGMHARKTGALIRAAAVSGAVMAGATGDQLGAIEAFARELGLAFQIVDDILDVEGAARQLGKTAGKDAAAGKPTYPALYGVARNRVRWRQRACDRGLGRAARRGHRAAELPAIADWVFDGRTERDDTRSADSMSLVVERGLAGSRERARALILAGQVHGRRSGGVEGGDGRGESRASCVSLQPDHPYVGRGGVKLAHALDAFAHRSTGHQALDIGASTGGFTDVLLQRGARAWWRSTSVTVSSTGGCGTTRAWSSSSG